jgi:hypothetical protein
MRDNLEPLDETNYDDEHAPLTGMVLLIGFLIALIVFLSTEMGRNLMAWVDSL